MAAPNWIRYHLDTLRGEAEELLEHIQALLKQVDLVERTLVGDAQRQETQSEYERLRKWAAGRPLVRFLADDKAGLWKARELAVDLGWESSNILAPPMRVLELEDKRVVILHDPLKRGLIEPI